MVINRANMDALFNTYNTAFSAAQQAAAVRATPNAFMISDVAIMISSTGAATVHAWLEQIKAMREWIDERVINNIKLGKLTVINRDFENTVAVDRNDIEDDQYGQFAPLIGAMGADADGLWDRLGIEALTINGNWADGNAFFCSDRIIGDSTITNAVTTALSLAAVEAGLVAMQSYTLYGGEPADVSSEYLVVGPSLEATAKAFCEALIVANTAGTAGISNVSPAMMLKVRVSRRLVGTHAAKWYITGRKGGIPAIAVQKRKLPTLTRMDKNDDENVFMSKKFLYGTDARGESFLTMPFLAYAGGLSSVDAWAAA